MSRRTLRAVGRAAYLVAGVGRAGDTAGAGLGCPGDGGGRRASGSEDAGCGTPERTERRRRCAPGAAAAGRSLCCARVCFVPADPGVSRSPGAQPPCLASPPPAAPFPLNPLPRDTRRPPLPLPPEEPGWGGLGEAAEGDGARVRRCRWPSCCGSCSGERDGCEGSVCACLHTCPRRMRCVSLNDVRAPLCPRCGVSAGWLGQTVVLRGVCTPVCSGFCECVFGVTRQEIDMRGCLHPTVEILVPQCGLRSPLLR